MYDGFNTFPGLPQPVGIADIADEKTHLRKLFVGVKLRHFELLQLIPRVDDDAADFGVLLQQHLDKLFPERTRATSYQDRIAHRAWGQFGNGFSGWIHLFHLLEAVVSQPAFPKRAKTFLRSAFSRAGDIPAIIFATPPGASSIRSQSGASRMSEGKGLVRNPSRSCRNM